jgi:hypothetical protein
MAGIQVYSRKIALTLSLLPSVCDIPCQRSTGLKQTSNEYMDTELSQRKACLRLAFTQGKNFLVLF